MHGVVHLQCLTWKDEIKMEFLVSIEKDKLRTYERINGHFEPFFIEGGDCFFYEATSIKQDVEEYLRSIAHEKNLADASGIELIVLENFDELLNSKFQKVWGNHVKQTYQVQNMMGKVFNALQKNEELLISKYGINYDGYSFAMRNGQIEKSDFDLLAYTIHATDLINLNLFDH